MGNEFGLNKATKPEVRLDGVGVFYLIFLSIWSVLILAGVGFLYHKRKIPFLRIRGLPLTFASIFFLHLYWISVQLVYPVGPVCPEIAEFWIMGLWYPLGIGLFQAANTQMLHVAKVQKKFARAGSVSEVDPLDTRLNEKFEKPGTVQKVVGRFHWLSYALRLLIIVMIGFFFQFLLTLIVYLISRKFHSGWGIPSTQVHGTPIEQKMQQGKGWEWWPSLVWQFSWAWIVAPITLWHARNIRDTHGWRLQTIACCIAGLPATPMWLVGLYAPGMESVNMYWAPPQWIATSVMLIEIFAIFLPCWQVIRHQALQKETLDAIAFWQKRMQKGSSTTDSNNSFTAKITQVVVEKVDRILASDIDAAEKGSSEIARSESIFTMEAMEHTLNQNPEPLRQFSAYRDFSGENIAFLTTIMEWKKLWPRSASRASKQSGDDGTDVGEYSRRDLFKRAVRIYATYCSPQYAEFPLNVSDKNIRHLDILFEDAARILYGDSRKSSMSSPTPFDDMEPTSPSESEKNLHFQGDADLFDLVNDKVQFWGEIPKDFDEKVFDDTEASVKYLVLTNTWPKYVREKSEKSISSMSTKRSSRYWIAFSLKGRF